MSNEHKGFTPGPWRYEYHRIESGGNAGEVLDADGEPIARLTWHPVRHGNGHTSTDRDQNGALIADAPRLAAREVELEAEVETLRSAHEVEVSWRMEVQAEVERLRAALAGCRRSNGHGSFVDCWCDSEHGKSVQDHTSYCIDARRALAGGEE